MKNGKEWSNGEPYFSFITFILLTKQSKRSEASFITMGCIHRIIVHDLGWDSCFWNENGKKNELLIIQNCIESRLSLSFWSCTRIIFPLWTDSMKAAHLLSFKSMKLDGHTCASMYTSGFQMLMQLDLREFELTWTHSNSSIVDFQNTNLNPWCMRFVSAHFSELTQAFVELSPTRTDLNMLSSFERIQILIYPLYWWDSYPGLRSLSFIKIIRKEKPENSHKVRET